MKRKYELLAICFGLVMTCLWAFSIPRLNSPWHELRVYYVDGVIEKSSLVTDQRSICELEAFLNRHWLGWHNLYFEAPAGKYGVQCISPSGTQSCLEISSPEAANMWVSYQSGDQFIHGEKPYVRGISKAEHRFLLNLLGIPVPLQSGEAGK